MSTDITSAVSEETQSPDTPHRAQRSWLLMGGRETSWAHLVRDGEVGRREYGGTVVVPVEAATSATAP